MASPSAAVQVFIGGSGIRALSQANGRYRLLNVPAGTHTLTAERIGYGSLTRSITVVAGETAVADFTMSESALDLDEIVVTGTAGGGRQREVPRCLGWVATCSPRPRGRISAWPCRAGRLVSR